MNLFKYAYNLVRQIPQGKISSYGAVAEALGDKIAARAVGRMMNQNPDADTMPCYKIVHSDGRLGGFGLGIDDKIRRLKQDKINVKNRKIVDFESVFFKDFKTEFPLKKLRKKQIELSKKVVLKDCFKKIETVAGVDIAYPENEFEDACGACVVVDYKTKEVVEKKTVLGKTSFPYISTYLAYRELPIIKKLVKSLNIKPTVFLFDGNGILHPYGIGLASHVGVALNMCSIGVAKSLLYGKIENNIVTIDGIKRGFVFFSSEKIKKPIYVSPGNKISFETSLKIVKNLSIYKIPEPLRQAHILAGKNLRL
ncbi:MAG: endonuclease V [Candidatus Thermoplasmatota archaeon]|jgi:deoxyribonuclease V|nr:endonuclease V [Candidatus Thermoplasmatota archaeon]